MKETPLPHDLDFKLAELLDTLRAALNKPLNPHNAPSFLIKCFFKLEFPKNFKEAETFVTEKATWNTNDGFEKLLAQIEKLSAQTAKTNPGFVSYSTCTNTTVPTRFPRGPWMPPVIDGVFGDSSSSSSSSASLSDVLAQQQQQENNATSNNNNSSTTTIISQDAKAAGDYDDDNLVVRKNVEDDSESDEEDSSSSSSSESEEDSSDDDDEEQNKNNNNNADQSNKTKAEIDLIEDKKSGQFSRWARQAALQKQRSEALARRQAALNNGAGGDDDDKNNGNDGPSGMLMNEGKQSSFDSHEQQQNDLDELLYNMLSESTKERSAGVSNRLDKNVEERLGKLHGFTMKQKSSTASSASAQQQQQMNSLISTLSKNTTNTTSASPSSNNKNELASYKLASSSANNNNNESSENKNSKQPQNNNDSTTTFKKAPMKMSFLRRSTAGGGADVKVEAKQIYVPTDSDIAKASQTGQEEREKEKRDLVKRTVRLAKDSELNENAPVGGQTVSGSGASSTGGRQNISRHQQLSRKSTTTSSGEEAAGGLSAQEMRFSMRQKR